MFTTIQLIFSNDSDFEHKNNISHFETLKINKLSYTEDSFDILKNINFEISKVILSELWEILEVVNQLF